MAKNRVTSRLVYVQGVGVVEVPGDRKEARRELAKWPVYSDSLGVNPSQIPEAVEKLASVGIKAAYTEDGRAILTGPKHKRDWCKAAGMIDRNGGYSDTY